ncbi:LytR/AlgR family response regulator transcription factor [Aerococcus sanguinicola]|uniref:DNA-binding response regulator n=2 Tax=Aerococcus sanguinicola TaxID=119206 RepID=A0A109REV0_9LACT|nr:MULTISPECIES: LytTR family DNA-binding domain-containing protein [Aerococcus]AMB94106.1 hypothetical protein AWM72_04705 [Aerococcus sanguinicola]MDK7050200.1 LytTR family DNA-binding domain-containing protein [Aerococcus sanguinicola]OFT93001.1 hypothetical protein HMPREF3090_07730 [Aerococcus sp. HMSC23C02]PKZ22196.1 DNA-binding response regulator [Aerococcus sanguinicola]
MIDIYICMSDSPELKQFKDCILNYIMINNYDMQVSLATDNYSKLLCHQTENKNKLTLFFLDIHSCSQHNGIEVASKIKKSNPLASIVFISRRSEMMSMTFQYAIEPLDFIVYGSNLNVEERIRNALDAVYQKYSNLNDKIGTYSISIKNKVKVFDINKIIYFESSSKVHRVILHYQGGNIEYYDQLKTIEQANTLFFRCHQSFIVNINQIKEIDKKRKIIVLNNGETCPVSSRKLNDLLTLLK